MAAMKLQLLLLSVLVTLALTAPASATSFAGNSRLGESFLDARSLHVGGELSSEGLQGSGGAWLERAAEDGNGDVLLFPSLGAAARTKGGFET